MNTQTNPTLPVFTFPLAQRLANAVLIQKKGFSLWKGNPNTAVDRTCCLGEFDLSICFWRKGGVGWGCKRDGAESRIRRECLAL